MYLVLIGGGHASGKRTVAKDLVEKLENESESVCSLNINVFDLAEYQTAKHKPELNIEKLVDNIKSLKDDKFAVVVIYGNYALFDESLCEQAQLRIFLDTDADVRLSQWILRDSVHGKKQPLSVILEEYLNNCRPEFEDYIEYTKHKADVLLPQGADSLNIELMAAGILEEILNKDQTFSSALRGRSGTPMINLRAEVASNSETQYYSTT